MIELEGDGVEGFATGLAVVLVGIISGWSGWPEPDRLPAELPKGSLRLGLEKLTESGVCGSSGVIESFWEKQAISEEIDEEIDEETIRTRK